MGRIIFSRHAKRRARLYDISESTVAAILKNMNLVQGEHEIVKDVPGFKYPLKIAISVVADAVTVITTYPLKKRRKK